LRDFTESIISKLKVNRIENDPENVWIKQMNLLDSYSREFIEY